jgi:DNA-binding IscR family transcriptional regulator
MLSSTSDYALRAILVLARHHGGGSLRADEITDARREPLASTTVADLLAG